jgi:hypothetical protein
VDLARAAAWHRQVAALAAAADRAGLAGAELPAIQARLLAQQSGIAQAAARARTSIPELVPTPAEISAAGAGFGDLSDAAIDQAIRGAIQTLDATDAELKLRPVLAPGQSQTPGQSQPGQSPPGHSRTPGQSQTLGRGQVPSPSQPSNPSQAPGQGMAPRQGHPPSQGQTPPPYQLPESASRVAVRNGLVYGGFAATVLVIQIALFFLGDEATTLPVLAPVCLVGLPAFAWLGGWLTVGAAFRSGPGTKVNRTPRLGAVICLMPNALLCAALGVLFLAR